MTNLHVGCGLIKKPGWINIDVDASVKPDVVLDVSAPLPYGAGTVHYVYSEHCFEHLTLDEGLRFLRDCRRVLAPGGVIRLSMPDLRQFALDYLAGVLDKWTQAGWRPESPAQMLNEEFRNWGHKFIYDFPELRSSLIKAGFDNCTRMKWGESEHVPLQGIDLRPEPWGDLIVESIAR